MEKLLPYLERELGVLRRAGPAFAHRYPKLAGGLRSAADSAADPHVERLIQGAAVLNARVGKLLDDGYAGYAEALLGMLYPHYLRPMPSCSIARVVHDAAAVGATPAALTVPRGAPMAVPGPAPAACRFRSVYDVTVCALAIGAAWFEPHIAVPAALARALPPDAGAAICITLHNPAGAALPPPSKLRVFIDGESSLRASLRDGLFMRAAGAVVEVDGRWRVLDKAPIAPVGFADDEALLPAPQCAHGALRLLAEYFAFPEKFDFFDLDLDAALADAPTGWKRLTVRLALAGCRADQPAARVLRALDADNFVLGCTPIVNLFAHGATPIRVTHARSSYPLVPDPPGAADAVIYSVDAVHLVRADDGGVAELFPYYAPGHGGAAGGKGRYWRVGHDVALRAGGSGRAAGMLSLTLSDPGFSPLRKDEATASVRLTCTNGDLPHHMAYGRARGDLTTDAAGGGLPLRVLRRPTTSYRLGARGSCQWALICHLALNHRSPMREGLPALKALLRLYARPGNAVSQRQIDGITGLSSAPVTVWLRQAQGSARLHGTQVTVTIDEEAFAGTGLHLFAQVLDHVFGLQVHLNSYTQLVIAADLNGKELLRCPPRNGMMRLA